MKDIEREEKMGIIRNHNKQIINEASKPRNGGLRTMPFIIVNESFEKVASYGLSPNMIFYLKDVFHMETAASTGILFLWNSISNFMAIFGAFLSDSYLGRFPVIALGSFSSLLGMTLLWLTSIIPQLKPSSTVSANGAQLSLLYSSLGLMSIGAGCIRPCSIAFGADQLDNKENPNNERVLGSFFNWYYASVGISTVISLTVIVYIQDNWGWQVGFGVPVVLMVFSVLMFLVGSSLYVKVKPAKSIFTGFLPVLVVAFKNRKMGLPRNDLDRYCHDPDSKFLAPSDNLRCLNNACIIRDGDRDLNPNGTIANPWNLCTVEQVESLKSLLRIFPIWSTGIIVLVCINQTSFSTLQANTMNRQVTNNFTIPAGSFSVFMIVSLTIWVAFYDRMMVPLLVKYTGQPRGLSPKVRMGIGLVLSCIAMAIAAIIETIRRGVAISSEDKSVIDMSAMWLVPQFVLFGLAEGLNAIGQMEFFYSHLPKSMSSIAVALYTVEMGLGSLVESLLVDIVNGVTSDGGKISWLANDLSKGHLDYYYWLCSVLGMVNFLYFLICCWAYDNSVVKGYASDGVGENEYRVLPSS